MGILRSWKARGRSLLYRRSAKGDSHTVGKPCRYIANIGGLDGQQEFVFQWLRSVGLIECDGPPRHARLNDKGRSVLALLEGEAFYAMFELDG
jgi:hypothetical protein